MLMRSIGSDDHNENIITLLLKSCSVLNRKLIFVINRLLLRHYMNNFKMKLTNKYKPVVCAKFEPGSGFKPRTYRSLAWRSTTWATWFNWRYRSKFPSWKQCYSGVAVCGTMSRFDQRANFLLLFDVITSIKSMKRWLHLLSVMLRYVTFSVMSRLPGGTRDNL